MSDNTSILRSGIVDTGTLDRFDESPKARARQEVPTQVSRPFNGTLSAYAKAALDEEVGKVAAAAPNDRHRSLIAGTLALGELVAGGEFPDPLMEERLREACTTNGMLPGREREFERAIRDGLAKGRLHPRRGDQARRPSTSTKTLSVEDAPMEPDGFFDEQGHSGRDLSDYHATDLGNAQRFVAMHRDVVRYVPALRSWLVWDGRCWGRDSLGAVYQLARKTVAAIYAEAAKEEDADRRRKLVAFALGSESEKRLQSMVSLAATEEGIAIHEHDLDRDPWLLNVANGTLDLRTGALRDPDPADLITYSLDVAYDPDAKCPLWMGFLARIFNFNEELHAFVQRAMGYTLTGATREQVFFLLYGTGKNGKTVFIETIRSVLGDLARMARFESFLVKRGDQIPSDIARLKGARFVTAVETQDGRRLDEAMVKQLTGGDTVTARFHYKGEFEFKPTFKLFLTSNYKPVIQGQDLAIWRRVKLIPFTVTIPEEERDLDLGKKLLDERPGILAWMVHGARLFQESGLGTCDAVEEHTRQYQSEQDTVGRWLDENCEFSAQAEITKKDLYAQYKQTTVEAGETPLSDKKFSKRMREIHPEIVDDRVGTKRFWRGVKLA